MKRAPCLRFLAKNLFPCVFSMHKCTTPNPGLESFDHIHRGKKTLWWALSVVWKETCAALQLIWNSLTVLVWQEPASHGAGVEAFFSCAMRFLCSYFAHFCSHFHRPKKEEGISEWVGVGAAAGNHRNSNVGNVKIFMSFSFNWSLNVT